MQRGTQPARRPAGQGAQRRPMTRRQYEALQRQRRQNRMAIGVIAAIAVVIVIAVVLILRPRPARDTSVQAVNAQAQATVQATAQPEAAATLSIAEAVAAEATAAVTAAPEVTAVPEVPEAIAEVSATARPSGALRSVRMRVVGDIMVCQTQLDYEKAGGYDFHGEFELVADLLKNADYTMGNMEGTVGKYNKKPYTGYPLFNCPETILETLKDCGIDFLTLANNHMLDRYFDGMKNTVNWVEQYGFDHVGAYRSQQERNTPVIYEIGGIKFGFVAYTHTTNTQEKVSDPEGVAYGVPYLYKADIEGDIKRLRDAGAEVVIAFPHWGKEYVRTPDDNQKKYAKKLAKAGADIIIGSHSHEVQPMGYQTIDNGDGTSRQVFTMFSMGNFISDHVLQYTDCGVILDFTVNEQADGSFTCDNVGYIPTYTWQQNGAVKVLPSGRYLNNPPAGMDSASAERMKASYYEIIEVIGDKFQLING